MALSTPPVITQNGDIDVLDKGSLSIYMDAYTVTGNKNLADLTVKFYCGAFEKTMDTNGVGKNLVLSSADLEVIEKTSNGGRFAVVITSETPAEVLWEGLIFIRNVD